jgi:hypothetical protein
MAVRQEWQMQSEAGEHLFVCWSGDRSKKIAREFVTLTSAVNSNFHPTLSIDLPKGLSWHASLTQFLTRAWAGAICLVPENTRAPWLQYEAGAIAGRLSTSARACTLLFGVKEEHVPSPLSEFQSTHFSLEDFRRLFVQLNGELDEGLRMDPATIRRNLENAWSTFEARVKLVLSKTPPTHAHDVHVGSFKGYLAAASQHKHTAFQEYVNEELGNLVSIARDWSEGEAKVHQALYESFLLSMYRSARETARCTSVGAYRQTWQSPLGDAILQAHESAYRAHGAKVERFFIFDRAKDVKARDISIMGSQQREWLEPLIWCHDFDQELSFADIQSEDFTLVDDSAIGVTTSFKGKHLGATWYFGRHAKVRSEVSHIFSAMRLRAYGVEEFRRKYGRLGQVKRMAANGMRRRAQRMHPLR